MDKLGVFHNKYPVTHQHVAVKRFYVHNRCHEKTYYWGLLPYKHARLQRLAFTLNYAHSNFSYYTFKRVNNKCADQTLGRSDHRILKFGPKSILHNDTVSFWFVLFDLILYVLSTIFQLCRDGSSLVEPVLS